MDMKFLQDLKENKHLIGHVSQETLDYIENNWSRLKIKPNFPDEISSTNESVSVEGDTSPLD